MMPLALAVADLLKGSRSLSLSLSLPVSVFSPLWPVTYLITLNLFNLILNL
jgi:hypothetical protein